ncbi:MAG: type IV toxin-antitoxin system AbiEi family antitoxin domain-containing protein [Acidobacteriaceae bacterium]
MQTPNEPQKELYRIAEVQGGYFTTKQATSLGYASNKRTYQVEAGNWLREHRGIYRLALFPEPERPVSALRDRALHHGYPRPLAPGATTPCQAAALLSRSRPDKTSTEASTDMGRGWYERSTTPARREAQSGTNFRPFLDSFRICANAESILSRSRTDRVSIKPASLRVNHKTLVYLCGIGHVPSLELATRCQNAPQLPK